MLVQLKIEQVEPMHAQRLCVRYMQTAKIIDLAQYRLKRQLLEALKACRLIALAVI